jgi:xanthine dehydrogenase YagR molybdenum-binding subunit
VTSAIARGRVARLDTAAARAVPGVLDILTHENARHVKALRMFSQGGTGSTSIAPLSDTRVWHDGQIVALVVADSFEAAREAAARVEVDYAAETPSAGFDAPGTTTEAAASVSKRHKDPQVGQAEQPMRQRRSRSTRATPRRPSTTIRWSCSRPPAPGRATS